MGIRLRNVMAAAAIALVVLSGACGDDAEPRADESGRDLSVVDVRAAVEGELKARNIGGSTVHDDGQAVHVYLPNGSEPFGKELQSRYGERVRVTSGPPVQPVPAAP